MQDKKHQLLIVDDDEPLAQMLFEYMEMQGFEASIVGNGEAALETIADNVPDLVILDVMMPGIDGFETLRRIRSQHDVPVIMLTARGDESERILGLTAGADDYLPKPFNPLELTARIRNVLKRSNSSAKPEPDFLKAGELHMDLKRRQLKVNSQTVSVTAAELRVLEQLMRYPGEVLSRARLTETALDRPIEAYDRSIDTLISKLRKKLSTAGFAGEGIRNLRGHGYVLDVHDAAEPD